MKKLLLSCMVFAGSLSHAYDQADVLRAELRGYNQPNLSPETQPALFALVAELSEKAGVPTPKYISMYNAIYYVVPEHGGPLQAELGRVDAHVDLHGDLHICWDVLKMLSYDEIRGVLALGLASKAHNVPWKQLKMFAGILAAALAVDVAAAMYFEEYSTNYLEKTRNVAEQEAGKAIAKRLRGKAMGNARDENDVMVSIFGIALIPSFVATYLYGNKLQKGVDLAAADIVEARNVIKGIQGIARIIASYQKESLWSRYAPENLKRACNVLFYYVRPFSDKERIAYLGKKARQRKVAKKVAKKA